MAVINANNSASDFWKTPPRGFRHATTGEPIDTCDLNRFLANPAAGGPPMRAETDEEYTARTGQPPY